MKRHQDENLIKQYTELMEEELRVYRMTPEEQAAWIYGQSQIYTEDVLVSSFAKRYDEIARLIAKKIRHLCRDMMLQICVHKALGGDYGEEQSYHDTDD